MVIVSKPSMFGSMLPAQGRENKRRSDAACAFKFNRPETCSGRLEDGWPEVGSKGGDSESAVEGDFNS